ncbi:hypothetical protein T484DRAFT_2643136 [Baffinella frigidus]|nr:hypothetical protein T484DRAFT_2643136 [Cryptophyta sp. CCMP2293]
MKRNQVWDNPDDDDELSKKWAAYEKRESYHEQRAAKRLKIEQALLAANMSLEDYEFSSDSRDDDGNEKPNRQKEHVPQNTTDPEVPADLGRTFKGASICDTSSVYELRAIVTHEGRSADGGHYICWVKSGIRVPKQGKNDNAPEKYYWLHFNDDKVTLEYEEDVKNCAGSADGPIVYIALYGKCDQVGEGLIDDTIKPRKLDKRDRDEFKRCMQPYAENQAEILWEEYQRAQEDRRKWD